MALSAIAPYGALLGITALGQMLVIMTGGIDLSVPGTFTLAAVIMVGVGQQSDERIGIAILTAVGAAALVGLVNGILIGGLKLNALIVTLAVGQVVIGVVNRYGRRSPVQSPVPTGWSDWVSTRIYGVSPIFWLGGGGHHPARRGIPIHDDRSPVSGSWSQPRCFPCVGVRVNSTRSWHMWWRRCSMRMAGVALAGLLRSPGVSRWHGRICWDRSRQLSSAGASLTGGLASPLSTFAAAFFLTGLNQMMRTMGLPTALQFVVFGLVIIGGMLISGDRIIKGVERVFRERRRPKRIESETRDLSSPNRLRKETRIPTSSHQQGRTERHGSFGGGS